MRYLIFLLPIFLSAQTIHTHDRFGNLNPLPSVKIEETEDGVKQIYNYNRFGVRDDLPKFEIRDNQVFRFNEFGVRQPLPIITIKTDENKTQTRVYPTRTFRTVRDPRIRLEQSR